LFSGEYCYLHWHYCSASSSLLR